MELLITLVIGFIVGAIAKFLVPGPAPGGIILTIVLGISGAFLARYIGLWSNWYGQTDAVGFFAAVVGAVIILLIYQVVLKSLGRNAPLSGSPKH